MGEGVVSLEERMLRRFSVLMDRYDETGDEALLLRALRCEDLALRAREEGL